MKPLVVQQAADYRMDQQIKTFVFDLHINHGAGKVNEQFHVSDTIKVLTHHKGQRMI